MSPPDAFLAESVHLLEEAYLPRLRRALEALPADDLWWRPNDASNSVGNLLLHMAGNLRQWVVSGVGGAPDGRRRREEFDAGRGARGADPGPLLTTLETAVAEAVSVIRRLDPADLDAPLTVQGRSVTVLAAIYHAVEHFSMHLGQILWIAKARTGLDLGLYRDGPDGHPRPSW